LGRLQHWRDFNDKKEDNELSVEEESVLMDIINYDMDYKGVNYWQGKTIRSL
jgi:hypothetical protein